MEEGKGGRMPVEREVKFLDVDHDRLRGRLRAMGALYQGRWLEGNLVLDDAAGGLFASGRLLRLRRAGGRATLTFKGAAQDDPVCKICREHETDVTDHEETLAILEGIGFRRALEYEKFREVWAWGGGHVCLDLLPFGSFLEIEGEEAMILECVSNLELSLAEASAKNYHQLNQERGAGRGLSRSRDFVFSSAERQRLLSREDVSGQARELAGDDGQA